ncbi:permease-like cell division protein FtsX [Wenzhouxiangella sp. XN24]|uniref:permease-like cell division protein FtsX n=1 Tax=Wenzhouxiangella sp. XN24 TaxID=2713569 RepID=UPI0013EC92EE|nr:permease-like cell division protein FtsX [Wenzhouxiangella sp. XN24]NGX17619.1 cell division protein [Wenzhouxiangella sp. XN24]
MPSRASRPKASGARRGTGRRNRRPSLLARLSWPNIAFRWPGAGLLGHLRTWLQRHVQTMIGSLGRLSEQPVATGMTLAVIGVALALPASLHLLVANLQALSGHWDDGIELSLYLEHGQSPGRAAALAEEIRAWPEVEAVELVTADEALARFRAGSGLGATVDALDANPLPHLVIVRPAARGDEAEAMEALAARLRALPEADIVQADAEWVRRLSAMLEIAGRLALLAAGLLAVGVLVIVGNTIRLDIQNRRDEIEVMKLVGGTDGFIRRPLLYGGFWYGLGGGLVALIIVQGGLLALGGPAARLAELYGSGFRPTGLGGDGALALLAAGAALGWLGAWVSATRHLRRIEPGI